MSQHGVVFFRVQDGLDDNLQKTLAHRLGELSGKPIDTKLHIHSVPHSSYEGGAKDPEITIINSRESKTLYKGSTLDPSVKKQSHKDGWHSDITYEPVPSDYAVLRLTELPGTGGGIDYICLPCARRIADIRENWIHSGPPAMNSSTVSPAPTRSFSKV